jgi:hypothetical protein
VRSKSVVSLLVALKGSRSEADTEVMRHTGDANGSLYPWIAPLVSAILGGIALATGSYVGGAILAVSAIAVRWLHQIGIDRGEYPY